MIAAALWLAALCTLVVVAALLTARARTRPSDVIERAPFLVLAIGYAALLAAAVWTWGGADAFDARDARVRAGARVALVLHDIAGTPHEARTFAAAGDVLRLGRADEPVPGLTSWELPAATSELLAIPADPTSCAAWPGGTRGRASTCEIAVGVFHVTAVPLVPDAGAVLDRDVRAVVAVGVPLVLACCLLASLPRSRRRAPVLARFARVAALGGGLAALACWRLAWAYRIDMLRALSPAGPRLADNTLAAALIAATLAGLLVRRWYAAGVWLVALIAAWLVLHVGTPHVTVARGAAVALSVVAVYAPRAGELARRRVPPDLVLAAIAIAALGARALHPPGVLVKLALAYALVLAGHGALRELLSRTSMLHRVRLVGALAAACGALASYDTGVALAIGGVGLALAMIVAGHDASYDASAADRIGVLEREHARLVAAHGALAIVVAAAAIAVAAIASDRAWLERAAPIACQAPLAAAAMFALAAAIARTHRRAWLPHAAAALAAIALWGVRGNVIERATASHGTAGDRLAAVVDPGYALLRDEHRFAATAAAWREAALPDPPSAPPFGGAARSGGAGPFDQPSAPPFGGAARSGGAGPFDPPSAPPFGGAARSGGAGPFDRPDIDIDRLHGEGLFGARIVDPGVIHSIENDYLPVLVARETGIAGIARTIALLLALIAAAGAFAGVGTRHASRGQRGRWLVAVVLGVLCVYQPLASLGVLPLTGISWPGLGIDSPADLWVLVILLAWCALAEPAPSDGDHDERVRATPRVVRARKIAVAALASCAVAGGIVVARSAAMALARVPAEDVRIAAALQYAPTIACPWHERDGAIADVVPAELGGAPSDAGTTRFDRELRRAYAAERPALLAAAATCTPASGHWSLAARDNACVATFHDGAPSLSLVLAKRGDAWHATCAVTIDRVAADALRGPSSVDRGPRVRVVATALGASSRDVGELIAGARVVRMHAGSPKLDLAAAPAGLARAGSVAIAPGVHVDADASHVVLHGDAELYVELTGAWRRVRHSPDVALDQMSLVVAGPPEHRSIVQVRPGVEPLLADDVDHGHRTYPYGSALPELGWVSPFDVRHSLGLDGWIHAALREPATAAPSCGTLAPPAIARDRVCKPSSLDGVTECRVTVQPELELALADVAAKLRGPTRVGYVVLRGDTGELLARGDQVPGRRPLAYAPRDRDAERELVQLREQHGESDRERVEWNLPIAVGSTFKSILGRAAERAFPDELHALDLTAAGSATGCKAHRGVAVSPLLGHCPPSSLADDPTTADAHDFLARSLNWYQAALGIIGLALPDASLSSGGRTMSLPEVTSSDLASWPTSSPLEIADAQGAIVRGHSLVVDGLRRTPLWKQTEAVLGRPLCTLGDRASCERAADRADVCAARALPIAQPTRDLRYLVALGPDRLDLYPDDTPAQTRVPMREYFQLLRGAGVHPIGSLSQLADAFARIVYDSGKGELAASWFPAPAVGSVPSWTCSDTAPRTTTVLGAGGGLCGVVEPGGTAHVGLAPLLSDARVVVYGAKTGTTDSLASIAAKPAACAEWNAHHATDAQLACGKRPADDSLLVIAFGVVTKDGTMPLVLALQLQRGGSGSAAKSAPAFVDAIAHYLID